jgi:hypothetical protein
MAWGAERSLKLFPVGEFLYVFVTFRAGFTSVRHGGKLVMAAEAIGRINSPLGGERQKKSDEK